MKHKVNTDEFSWGFHDQTVATSYFKFMDEYTSSSPYFNLWLTLSLHSPFDIPNKETYLHTLSDKFVQLEEDFIHFNKDPLAAVCYTDDALKYFFEAYKNRPEFKNTVFILMGDHAVLNLNNTDVLGIYNIPLIIYSPQLKKAEQFNEVISHWDIPATLISLLKKQNTTQLKGLNWLGDGVNFSQDCKAKTPIFLGTFKGDVLGVCWKDYLLMHGSLYKIEGDFKMIPVENEEVKTQYNQLLEDYILLNAYSINDEKIIPSIVTTQPRTDDLFE